MFYTDEVFEEIARYTNLNANSKRQSDPEKHKGQSDPEKHKGVWSEVSLDELKAFYGLLIFMDIMKLDRDELYWAESGLLQRGLG